MAIKGIFAAAMALCVMPAAADAAISVRIGNFGNDVVAKFSGSLNLAGTDRLSEDESPFFTNSTLGSSFFRIGGDANMVYFDGFSGPAAFGSGLANVASGFGLEGALALSAFDDTTYVGVASGYDGAAIAGASLFRNTSIAALGLTSGTYTYRSDFDTITVDVGVADIGAVPEPSTWALMFAGFAMVAGATRYRRRTVRARIA